MSGIKIVGLVAAMLVNISMTTTKGQTASYSQVMNDLERVRDHFKPESGRHVSCRVNYYYSMASDPVHYLDSLTGLYQLAGDSRYSRIGNTETILSDSVMIIVYNDDRTMMAGPFVRQGSAGTSGGDIFLNNLDSGFVARNAVALTITASAGVKTMTFHFSDTSRYYNCSLTYDANSYIPRRLAYVLRGASGPETGSENREKALVTIFFSAYSNTPFDNSALRVNKYITIGMNGKAFAQPAYTSYHFVQTANFPVNIN